MKHSSENPQSGAVNRETAMGFLAANMAIPGVGTFLAGHRVAGAIQTIVGLAGMGVSLVTGMKMLTWMVANWAQLHDPDADPVEMLSQIWHAIRWPLAGIVLFGVAWIWSVSSSMRLARNARRAKAVPPVL